MKKQELKTLKSEWLIHNKCAKRDNKLHLVYHTFESYLDMRYGKTKYVKKFKELKASNTYTRDVKHIPSFSETKLKPMCTKKESQKYSGDYIVGIATMHKSNLVPVGREDCPTDYSTMRRS